MLLDHLESDDVVLLACMLYSICCSVHMLRARSSTANVTDLKHYLWEGLKAAATQHSHTDKVVRSLRAC